MEPILTTILAVFEIIRGNLIRYSKIYSKIVATNIHFILRTYKNLLLLFLLFSGFMYRAVFIYQDIEFLTDFWLFEDAFYSLNIAKYIANGSGWTFDGVIPTNGFQPLYVFLMVPVYWALKTDIITPIYVALTFLAVFNVATGYLLYRISFFFSKSDLISILVTIIWLFNPSIARNGTNGLETGLSTFLFAMSIFYYIFYIRDAGSSEYKRHLLFGLILGVAFLARIDNIFIFILIGADQLLIHLKDWSSLSVQLLRKQVLPILAFSLVIGPYITYNYIKFSSFLPMSGEVLKNHPSKFEHFAFNFVNSLHNIACIIIGEMSNSGGVRWGPDTLFNNPDSTIPLFVLASIIVVLILFAYSYRVCGESAFTSASMIYILVFISAYEYIYSTFIFERYFYPIVFLVLVIVSIPMKSLSGSRNRNITIIFAVIALLLVSNGFALEKISSENYKHAGWYKGTCWLNKNLSENEIVAASQTGNTGYFYKGRAINLDGVVNYDAYKAYTSKKLLYYFSKNNISYLADESDWVFIALKRFCNPDEEDIIKSRMRLVHRTNEYEYNIYIINHSINYSRIINIDAESIDKTGSWRSYNWISYISDNILMAWDKGDNIQYMTDDSCYIRFLRHPWSGKANIYLDGYFYETVDLYYPVNDPTFDIYIPINKTTLLKVEVAGEKNDKSQGYQVWIDAIFYE